MAFLLLLSPRIKDAGGWDVTGSWEADEGVVSLLLH
jgi:hypothetical protein